MGAFTATKAALTLLADFIRPEVKKSGIQVSIIEPGFVRSGLTEKKKFPMPFIMNLDKAADIIVRQVADGASLVRFPWPIWAAMSLLRHVPDAVYDRMGTVITRVR